MDVLTPRELIEHINEVIESLTVYEDCYAALDVAYTLKEEVMESLQVPDEDEE